MGHLSESKEKKPLKATKGATVTYVFRDVNSIIYIHYLENEKTKNNEYYIEQLVRLKKKMAKTTHVERRKFFFY
jgi:hypothetical protein